MEIEKTSVRPGRCFEEVLVEDERVVWQDGIENSDR